jgi:hypothetical protein
MATLFSSPSLYNIDSHKNHLRSRAVAGGQRSWQDKNILLQKDIARNRGTGCDCDTGF